MKKYFLLRNNRQSGPYSFEQMSSIGLLPLDLVWIEETSTSWKYPEEIDELKPLIREENESIPVVDSWVKKDQTSVPLFHDFNQDKQEQTNKNSVSVPAINEMPETVSNDREELKENYRIPLQQKIFREKPAERSKHISTIAAVCLGVMVGALIIKKWVDGSASDTTPVTVAAPFIDRQPVQEPNENFKNALVTEIVPVYKANPKKSRKTADIRKQLKLQTNDYKVGLFGGINGLQLTVFNTSSQFVDKAIIAIDYLKPNGRIVQSENILFTSIKPKAAQTIAIPGSDRGVKVRYKILKIYSHHYKADLKQA